MPRQHTKIILFGGSLSLYLFFGYYITQVLGIYYKGVIGGANFFLPFNFENISQIIARGFIFAPLFSLLQSPFAFVLKSSTLMSMVGSFVSAIAGAFMVVGVYRIAELINHKDRQNNLIITLLVGLNPMIILYSALGLSEIVFVCSIVYFSYFFVKYFLLNKIVDIFLAGLFLAMSFWLRYEVLMVLMAVYLLFIIFYLTKKYNFKKIEGLLISFSAPVIYSIGILILLNLIFTGHFVYFGQGNFSSINFIERLNFNNVYVKYTNLSFLNATLYIFIRIFLMSPVLAVLPFLLIIHKKIRREYNLLMILIVPYLAILIFYFYQFYKGNSFGLLRVFIYVIIAGALLSCFIIKQYRDDKPMIRFVLVVGVFSIITSSYAVSTYAFGKEEYLIVNKSLQFSRGISKDFKFCKLIAKDCSHL